ncbi:glycoside hydrolase family 73 protein, partial [Weissella confusa]
MKKRHIKMFGFLGSLITAFALNSSVAHASDPWGFINKLSPDVRSVTSQYNLYASLQMAQAAVESGWGESALSKQANNYFGIKGTYNGQYVIMNTAEYDKNGNLYYIDAQFKKYPSAYQSMEDNARLLRYGLSWDPKFYSGTWRENAANGPSAADGLTGRYATSPVYAQTLKRVMSEYNLQSLDDSLRWEDGQLRYYYSNGTMAKNTWIDTGGNSYWFDAWGNAY